MAWLGPVSVGVEAVRTFRNQQRNSSATTATGRFVDAALGTAITATMHFDLGLRLMDKFVLHDEGAKDARGISSGIVTTVEAALTRNRAGVSTFEDQLKDGRYGDGGAEAGKLLGKL